MPKRIVWAMLKTKKRKRSMPKGMREKMHAKEHEEKKKNKDSPYFQIKDIYSKREIHDSKENQKYLELGLYEKIPHTCTS